ncbi:long-chain acyl-CoA synthetase [Nakamurella panacisegetis]|uniref:Long-chain acyl-CoA synthetase n=1 Tax=Nakamurella panacisegetis TaxID=1090615 RepID=A0A1H0NQR4_9ACTN|nr:class I adenylate-forming enzyme family protein [Nakamurella panacisegetis]SDO95117.1 long-chain acyl-CoA synthetase [Nakamurella panacisegetis]
MTSATTSGSGTPRGNVSDLLRAAATAFGDHSALILSDGTRSWRELDRAVDAGAAELVAAGLTPGSRVVVSLETGADIIAALFAVARAGLVAVPIGPDRADLSSIVARVGASAAITAPVTVPVPIQVSPQAVALWWGRPAAEFDPVGSGEDLAVLARAASSDRPVMVSHRAILAAVEAISATPRLGLRADDRAVLVLPTYHLAGWVTAFLPLTLVGAAGVIPDRPDGTHAWLDTVVAAIRRHRVTIVPGAPSLYRRLRDVSGVERALASVRLMTSGAAPLDPADFSAIKALTGQSVWEGYGISESASVISSSLMTKASRVGSVGKPLRGVSLRIVGEDGGDVNADGRPESAVDDLGADAVGGEVGRIQISGPTLFSGYWLPHDGASGATGDGTGASGATGDGTGASGATGDETGASGATVDLDTSGMTADGWFTTGDLGYFDDVGELHLVDRATETIRVAGFTVYPREIEDVLAGHPYVRDAAVIGVTGRAGEAVAAVIVPLWGKHPTEADLDEYVAERLPVFKRPRSYHLVDRLPRNELGRIDRDQVRAMYRSSEPLESGIIDGLHVPSAGEAVAPRPEDTPVVPRTDPEPAAELGELGARLPGREGRRGDEDTDDDLF